MKRIVLRLLLLVIIVSACSSVHESAAQHYPEHVGDIAFDRKTDDAAFKPCDEKHIYQYYNFANGVQYHGEKATILEHFSDAFSAAELPGDNGYVTIRFVVNCEGKTGRFRIQEMDTDYKAKTFDRSMVDNLLKLTKSLDGWVVGAHEKKAADYYQYLTFKIVNGRVIEIMP